MRNYQILGRIAAGAMGQIYLARTRLGDGRSAEVLLKRIKPELQKDRAFQEMFYDEIRVASRMRHPNVIRVLEYGELDGSIFYAMELVPGVNFGDVIRRGFADNERIPIETALGIGVFVLDALDYAHRFKDEEGRALYLVHRDVTPQNILLSFDGSVKLLDFGVTKAVGQLHKTIPGMIKGKLAYMSPEQIDGGDIDARADLFSLGVVLYEAMFLRHPFPGNSDPAIITSIMRSDPPPPHELDPRFPRRLSDIVMTALSKDRDQRFGSADAMRSAISEFMKARGWEIGRNRIESYLRPRFDEQIRRVEEAYRDRNDEALVRALEVGKKKPLQEMPQLLAPPNLPSIDVVPEVRRPTIVETGDLVLVEGTSKLPQGERVGRYRLVERLHAGAREIHSARYEGGVAPKRFAIKFVSARGAADREARSTLIAELTTSLDLSHPNLIDVLEVGEQDGEPFGSMELCQGFSLDEIVDRCISRRARIPVGIACRIVADLCRALHYLHSRSILHRDISRPHVILLQSGEVKLTHPRSKSPSSPYAAPERLTPGLGPESPASDVYSAGVMLFECLEIGGVAFPDALEEVVDRAMSRAPDRRHESARALAVDLERVLHAEREPVTSLEVADWLQQLFPRTGARDR